MKRGIVSVIIISIFLSYLIFPDETVAKTLAESKAEANK